MDAFELALSTVPPQQKCVERCEHPKIGRETTVYVGVLTHPLHDREPLTTLPESVTGFHFYLGSEALALIDAFAKSKHAATVEHLSVGDSSYGFGRGRDYAAIVESLRGGFFPSLRSLGLGVWELFCNSHCMFGKLGDITRLFDGMPRLEGLDLCGCFELTSTLTLPALRRLEVVLDDDCTCINGGAISQAAFDNLLCSTMPSLVDACIDLAVDGGEVVYVFPESFLTGTRFPKLQRVELAGRFAPHACEQLRNSELARRTGMQIRLDSSA